jgi:hypothetical protein
MPIVKEKKTIPGIIQECSPSFFKLLSFFYLTFTISIYIRIGIKFLWGFRKK